MLYRGEGLTRQGGGAPLGFQTCVGASWGVVRVPCREPHLGPFLDPLLIPKWGGVFQGGSGPSGASEWPQTASRRARNARSSVIPGKKKCFPPFLTPYRSQKGPSEGLLGPSRASERSESGSEQSENVSLTTPNGLGSFLAKTQFRPFSDPFRSHFGAI